MKKKVIAWLLKAPLLLLMLAAFPVALYAASAGLVEGYGAAILIGIIDALYAYGTYMELKR